MNPEIHGDNPPDNEYERVRLHEKSPDVVVSAADFPADLPEGSTAEISGDWNTRKVGNMSSRYSEEADENLVRFLEGSGIDPVDVIIMKPQMNSEQPWQVEDADQPLTSQANESDNQTPYKRSETAATMIYSRDKDRVLVALTGDSPFLIGHGLDNEGRPVLFMIHLGWRVEESGYVRQSLEYARDNLGLDLTETYFVITPGAEKLDFTEKGEGPDPRFQNPGWYHKNPIRKTENNIRPVPKEEVQPGEKRFRVSMVGFATDLLQNLDVEPRQIFVHGSDVTDKSSAYSSDRKSKVTKAPVSRDAVVAKMRGYNETQERQREEVGRALGEKAVRP